MDKSHSLGDYKMKVVEPFREKEKIETMKAVLQHGEKGSRNKLIFTLGINTAYRISDLRQLKLHDVLTVSRKKVVVKKRLAMKEQKTGKNNSVYISNNLRKEILEYAEERFLEQIKLQDFDYYLFPSRKGHNQPITRQSLWRILSNSAKKIGLNNIGTHSMRKTFGYFLYKQNTSLALIQDLLNHSSQKETLRYIGITQEDRDTAVKSLNL